MINEDLEFSKQILGGLAKLYAKSINDEFIHFMRNRKDTKFNPDKEPENFSFCDINEIENQDPKTLSKTIFYRKLFSLNGLLCSLAEGMKAIDYLMENDKK